MIKILHTADWHLDSPLQGKSPEQTQLLRRELLALPGKISALCKQEGCQLVLISGDIFDGAYTADSLTAVKNALEEMAVPVFIAPGNHDFVGLSSPWLTEKFPANAHIFTKQALEEVYNRINVLVEQYNVLVEKYNSDVTRTEKLNRAMNSNSRPERL